MILKTIGVSIGLWIGTCIYYFIAHPDMLAVQVIDYCWFEFIGVTVMGFVLDQLSK